MSSVVNAMAARPSPSVSSNNSFARGSFSSSSSSPPNAGSKRIDVFAPTSDSVEYVFGMSPLERGSSDRSVSSSIGTSDGTSSGTYADSFPAIVIRRLPRNINEQALRSMLVFARDIVDVEFKANRYADDNGFLSAIAHFRTMESAQTARDMLHGKPNPTNDARLIVELFQHANKVPRHHISGMGTTPSDSSDASSIKASKFNGTFLNMSPSNGQGEYVDSASQFQNLFSPQSPLTMERPRVSGKSMINNDVADDETVGLLNDPLAYAKRGHDNAPPVARRVTNPQPLVQRLGNLSLSPSAGYSQKDSPSSLGSPPFSSFASPSYFMNGFQTQLQSIASPTTPNSKTFSPMSPNSSYTPATSPEYSSTPTNSFYRNNLNPPAANPADQNPPCNTLYVGNLPPCTCEDELKALFSRQRGYRRLCFRTKQQGPMCFVEFEDVSSATRCLNDLYGYVLTSSNGMNGGALGGQGWGGYGKGGVRGGIRLSFSKNPLGVRQSMGVNGGMMSPISPTSPYAGGFAGQGYGMPGFGAVSGPPPGLGMPPGLQGSPSGFGLGMSMEMGFGGMRGGTRELSAMYGASQGYSATGGDGYF